MCQSWNLFEKSYFCVWITNSSKTGHTINLEEPALFNDYISKFYQAIDNKSWKKR